MAEIIDNSGGDGKGKKKAKKPAVSMDMTPMVDLAFLLLTFFVLAATLAKPKTMEIIYPKKAQDDTTKTKVNFQLATTLLLGEKDNEIFYYSGMFKPDSTQLYLTDFSKDGFRKIMLNKNARINDRVNQLKKLLQDNMIPQSQYEEEYSKAVNDSLAPFVVVKTLPKTKYKNVIGAIDELNLVNVRKRAIQDMAESEAIALRQKVAELKLDN
ncbi:MAG TPA: biopolymer transporter ExbD [Flavobacteriales bacterium]|jgi:biopolymer transport protein ExbD